MAYQRRQQSNGPTKKIGSGYFNLPKDAGRDAKNFLEDFKAMFADERGYLTLSIKLPGSEDYTKFKAFMNTMGQKPTDCHINIQLAEESGEPVRKTGYARTGSTGYSRPARVTTTKPVVEEEDEDDMPQLG